MPQIQFIARVVDFPVVLQLRVPTVQTVQQTVEFLQVPFLGLVLTARCCASTGAWPYVPVITQRQVLSRCDSGGASASVHRQSGGFVVDRDRYMRKTVEIPQVQFLDMVFGDCGVDVPVISRLAPVRALH